MIEAFFSDLRGVASSLDGIEVRLRDREALDVDGPQHHALQQAALRKFKTDVMETKARMKTLQPTVVNIQEFGRLNEISSRLAALQRQRVEALKAHMTRYGYEEPPPAKLYKPSADGTGDGVGFSTGKENLRRASDGDDVEPLDRIGDRKNSSERDGTSSAEDEEMDVAAHADPVDRPPDVPSGDGAHSSTNSRPTATLVHFPESPPCPVLRTASTTSVASAEDHSNRPTNSDAALATVDNNDGVEDDSILAMELPPTPVCPEMMWQRQPGRSDGDDPDIGMPAPRHAISTSMSAVVPPPRTPAAGIALPMVHTPTPPILLSAAKKTLDVTKIDFSGLEDGEVFHTGLTPKTPQLHSFFSSMPPRPPSPTTTTTTASLMSQTGYLDTPFEGRATPPSPDSQQPIESLKRELRFGNVEATGTTTTAMITTTAVSSSSSTLAPTKPSVDLMKPVSFVEFEQKPQKVEGITRDVLNNAIKSLNAVFREKEGAKESLVLSQTQVDALFNEDIDMRLGTKIILMLLKFKRIDCRSANGQSYVSPFSEADDSMLDTTNSDD